MKGRRLADLAGSRMNNFDLIRLGAATSVMLVHSLVVATGIITSEDAALGGLSVAVFFSLSGFLIAKSWSDDPSPGRFICKRFLRIAPGLIVTVILGAFVVGPLVTTLPLRTYLTSPETWQYVVHNVRLDPVIGFLPGVFKSNPFPGAVNGSLWTLPVETLSYVALLALAIWGLLKSRLLVAGLLAALLFANWQIVPRSYLSAAYVLHMPARPSLWLFSFFLAGAACFSFRHRIVISSWFGLLSFALILASFKTTIAPLVLPFLMTYAVLSFGYCSPSWLRRLTAWGDVSYGMYIYAFPVQQSIVHLVGGAMNPWLLLIMAWPITYALSFASWRFIEKPALSLKRRLSSDKNNEMANLGSIASSEAA